MLWIIYINKESKIIGFGYKYPKLDQVWVLKIYVYFGFWVGI